MEHMEFTLKDRTQDQSVQKKSGNSLRKQLDCAKIATVASLFLQTCPGLDLLLRGTNQGGRGIFSQSPFQKGEIIIRGDFEGDPFAEIWFMIK